MIGIIVSGHGRFANGLNSAIQLIAGNQKDFVEVNFEHEVDQLNEDLKNAIESLKDCEGIIVFTDLAGGSPFKTASMLATQYKNIEVIAGTNLPMLAEVVMSRAFISDLSSLVNTALNTGKEQVTRLDLESLLSDNEEEEPEEGI